MSLQLTKAITLAVEKALATNPAFNRGNIMVVISPNIYNLLLAEQPAFRRKQPEPYTHTICGVPIYKAMRRNFNGWYVAHIIDGEDFV